MSSTTIGGRRIFGRGMFAFCVLLCADVAVAQTIQGTATYEERMALPAGSILEVTLEDVSRADAPALVIATSRIASPGNPPIAFSIAYDPARIVPKNRYVVRAMILLNDKPLFTSDTAIPVITQGSGTQVSITLRRVASTPSSSPSGTDLEGTYWKAVELAGKPVPAQDANREAHLVFEAGNRVAGSDGCNRVMGSYQLKGEGITLARWRARRCRDAVRGSPQERISFSSDRWPSRVLSARLDRCTIGSSSSGAISDRM